MLTALWTPHLTSSCLCRVGGELAERSVRHVGAGLNLTVACTTDGAVWQMGTTTASTKGVSAPWEGCSSPVQVKARTAVAQYAQSTVHEVLQPCSSIS